MLYNWDIQFMYPCEKDQNLTLKYQLCLLRDKCKYLRQAVR